MASIFLITGGTRSGKSIHATELAAGFSGRKAYVATSPETDDEMLDQIERHRKERRSLHFETIEEPTDLARIMKDHDPYRVVLVDCLTLWISNLLFSEGEVGCNRLTEDDIALRCEELLEASRDRQGAVIFVTNEVGLGVVPDNPLARRYRDLVGRCNQVIAGGADRVVQVVCGIPVTVKG